MQRRSILKAVLAGATALVIVVPALAQETIKIGLILPMTGPFASTGRQIDAAVKLYMTEKGNTVAGKKIEVIVKDDTNVADITKRLAQELVVNDGVIPGGAQNWTYTATITPSLFAGDVHGGIVKLGSQRLNPGDYLMALFAWRRRQRLRRHFFCRQPIR